MLYPLKFKPVFKEKIWGGSRVKDRLGFDFSPLPNCGEVWAMSGVSDCQTVVSNGFLEGNPLNEILEIYMDELVGEKVFDRHSTEFPILVKFIDASQWLSVQVHPDDELAARRGLAGGKTEMWYVMDADPGAQLISGFNRPMAPADYLRYVRENRLKEILNFEPVDRGDVFYIPSGRIHALGPGILLAEIQQTSDTTYRIYDWDRLDDKGRSRELHTDLALEAIDFSPVESHRVHYRSRPGEPVTLVSSHWFTTRLLDIGRATERDYGDLDSFVIYVCTGGRCRVTAAGHDVPLTAGEVMLIPAVLESVTLTPETDVRLLEICIP